MVEASQRSKTLNNSKNKKLFVCHAYHIQKADVIKTIQQLQHVEAVYDVLCGILFANKINTQKSPEGFFVAVTYIRIHVCRSGKRLLTSHSFYVHYTLKALLVNIYMEIM